MIPDRATAPPRPELTFLRHRSKPKPAAPQVADFVAGRLPHPPHRDRTAAEPAGRAVSPPAPPAPPARPPAAAPSASSSLDLSDPTQPAQATRPARPAPPAPVASGSLDLSDPAPPAQATQQPARPAPPAPRPRVHQDRRLRAGDRQLLSVTEPTVTLTRVQSGIGTLQLEAVCSPEVGDLSIGAAYQLRGGIASTVQYVEGNRFAPSVQRPVIVAGRDDYEHLRIDLRQTCELERLAVYAFSRSRSELAWGGTLVVTTFGAARVELPLETLLRGRVAVLLSIYNVDGEFVLRAEMETILDGDIREAARAYGYDRITWRDDRTPAG